MHAPAAPYVNSTCGVVANVHNLNEGMGEIMPNRINRLTCLLIVMVLFVAGEVSSLVFSKDTYGSLPLLTRIVVWTVLLVCCVPRFRDMGFPGWRIIAILLLAFLVGSFLETSPGYGPTVSPAWPYYIGGIDIVSSLEALPILVALFAVLYPGQPKENKWGPPPEGGINLKPRTS